MIKKEMIAMLLAGGQGSRLGVLKMCIRDRIKEEVAQKKNDLEDKKSDLETQKYELEAVSYTHRDVYKRQQQGSRRGRPGT